jgi:hypothetical protein
LLKHSVIFGKVTDVSNTNFAEEKEKNWFLSHAYLKLREGENYARLGRFAEAANSSFESIEFSLKALCKIFRIGYNPEHFIDPKVLAQLAENIGVKSKDKRTKLLGVLPIALSYSNQLRSIARYGIEKKDGVGPISPNEIFQRSYCYKVTQDARILADLLSDVELCYRWNSSQPIKIGVLNGYATDPTQEKMCQPFLTFVDTSFWENYFGSQKSGRQKYDVQKILTSEISDEYALLINPFGEAYPEQNAKNRDTYQQIKSYIEDGGVFANTAGFAFFYSWDVNTGQRNAISEERYLIPATTKAGKTIGWQEQFGFAGTFLYLDFRSYVTSDITGHSGFYETTAFQTKDDISRFGKLTPATIKEFRAVRSETGKNVELIPILRSKAPPPFNEVYPIAAMRYGKGLLVLSGFGKETKDDALLFAKALDGFCGWMSSQHRL